MIKHVVASLNESDARKFFGRYIRNYKNPYLLDTEKKVRWANAISADEPTGSIPIWRLGDHCWFKPV